jgi:hypothetical protein
MSFQRGWLRRCVCVLGPGQTAPDDVAGYHVVRMPTRFAFIGYRVLDRSEKDKLTPLKLYPYSERNNPPSPKVIAATKDFTQSHPRGLAYWEAVNELIQHEPVEEASAGPRNSPSTSIASKKTNQCQKIRASINLWESPDSLTPEHALVAPVIEMTATSESLSLQASDGGDSWSGKRLPSRST